MSSSFETQFCGGVFWDLNVTWYTEDPDFTPCFQKTVLAWSPTAIFFFFAVFELRKYLQSDQRNIPWNYYNLVKLAMTAGLVILNVGEIVMASVTANDDDPRTHIYPVDYVTPVVYLITFLSSLGLQLMAIRHGVRTSPAQFLFYFASFVCGSVTFRSIVKRKSDDLPEFSDHGSDNLLIMYTIQYCLVVFLFIANLFADAPATEFDKGLYATNNPSPRLSASYFSKLIYAWAVPLMWTGYRRPLEPTDLWDMDPKMTSRGVVPYFDENLGLFKSEQSGHHYNDNIMTAQIEGKKGSLTFNSSVGPKTSVFPAMLKTFGTPFFIGSAVKIIYDTLAVFNPQFMKLMIGYVESQPINGTTKNGEDPQEEWKGYFYACLLLVVTVFQSILLSQYFEKMFVVGMNLRTSLISTIYRKALRMNSASKKDSTVGEIVNLMSVDAQRFMDLIPYLNMLWSAPLQISLCCYFMYQELGPAVFSGVAVMVLTIPINTVVAKLSRRYQLEQMKNKDKRTKLMNEIIGGVKVLKLYGWEPSFMDQVLGIRDNEITVLKKSAWLMSIVAFIWTSVPFMVALASFATYVFMDEGNTLTAGKAFVTLSYLNIMRMPMAILPFLIIGLVQAGVSLDRVNKFMNNSELDPKAVEHNPEEVDPVLVEGGTFKWGEEDPEVLKDINIRVKKGSLTAVVGTVGAGKSSLISAILGEMVKVSGRVNVLGSAAFVPQQAWMQNVTLKENILFGKVLNNRIYERAIDACALRSDIAILPGGDQTEIGEKGINLSGGQKQRVALARAVYSQADLYLLDDPLSAVDSHVGKHIFDQVIGPTGELAGKTRLLVTHGITYLPKCDHIIVIKNGTVSEQGSYRELLDRKGAFADFLIEFMSESNETEQIDDEILHQLEESLGKDTLEKQLHRRDSHNPKSLSPQVSVIEELGRKSSNVGRKNSVIKEEEDGVKPAKPEEKKGTTLIEKENVETGSVKMDVYWYYMKNVGLFGSLLCISMQLLYQCSSIGTNYWLNFWANGTFGNSSEPQYRDLYLGVYGGFGLVQSIAVLTLTISLSITTLDASRKMHKTLLDRVMRSPMSFFDTTPLGRIVNRFAKDIDICDNTLPTNIRQWLNTFANFIGTIILIITVVPFFGVVIVPVAVLFYFVQTVYVSTSRQLKRLESVSRSPIYSHFGETLNGTSTIRAFGLENQFIQQSEKQVDNNHVCYYPSIITNRWLAVWLENIGNLITVAAALFAILDPDSVDPSEVGLIITYALNVTQVLNWLVRMTSDVETNIVAVERIKEYAEIEQEAKWDIEEVKPPKEWPQNGAIQFRNYGMRYREGLDLVVKGIDCDIAGGEMVGIVGRTGAGKSSLTVALFRLVEAAQGTITIDGIDISKIGLHDLRTKLTIIPQDPVLFSGSLRINLDPFNHHTDEEVWTILKLAHLHDFVSSLEAGLTHEVSEGGGNLSVGQRQLICLARALLRKTKVLILDEATAAVDLETDELIQSTIRKEFKGCTVLTIAHRLNTILDYDRIVVMDQGKIAEFDSPAKLIENKSSIFYSMIKDAGLANN